MASSSRNEKYISDQQKENRIPTEHEYIRSNTLALISLVLTVTIIIIFGIILQDNIQQMAFFNKAYNRFKLT